MLKFSLSKAVFVSVLLIFTPISQVFADTIGFHAGIVQWDQSWGGNLDSADLGTNTEIEDDKNAGFYAAIELLIPLLPNLKIQSTPMGAVGKVKSAFTYNGETTSVGADVDIQFDQQDVIFYNQLLDNWVSLDLGLALRRYDAEFVIENGANDIEDEASATIPMFYGAARFDLPLSGVYALAELMAISVGDNSISDYKIALGYESKLRVGAEVGLRDSAMEIDDVDDFSTDISVDGLYLALTLHL